MKKNIILSLVCAVFLLACNKSATTPGNQNNTSTIVASSAVPASVMSTFNTSFSGATEVEWRHNSDDSFTSEFNHEGQRHEARFDDHGNEKEHSIICLEAPVPQVVLDAFRNSFPNDDVFEWKLTSDNTWKAHFMRSGVQWEATFDNSGNKLKVEHD